MISHPSRASVPNASATLPPYETDDLGATSASSCSDDGQYYHTPPSQRSMTSAPTTVSIFDRRCRRQSDNTRSHDPASSPHLPHIFPLSAFPRALFRFTQPRYYRVRRISTRAYSQRDKLQPRMLSILILGHLYSLRATRSLHS